MFLIFGLLALLVLAVVFFQMGVEAKYRKNLYYQQLGRMAIYIKTPRKDEKEPDNAHYSDLPKEYLTATEYLIGRGLKADIRTGWDTSVARRAVRISHRGDKFCLRRVDQKVVDVLSGGKAYRLTADTKAGEEEVQVTIADMTMKAKVLKGNVEVPLYDNAIIRLGGVTLYYGPGTVMNV